MKTSTIRRWTALAILVATTACYHDSADPIVDVAAQEWSEANGLFRSDSRWLGGSGAASIDLGGNRTLWLFGASYVDPAGSGDRRLATRVNNTVAIQTGLDPSVAAIEFFWREDDGAAASFFADERDEWLQPLHGVRVGSTLTIFLVRMRDDGAFGQSLRTIALRIENPDDAPPDWSIRELPMPESPMSARLATQVMAVDGFIHSYAIGNGREPNAYLLRWSETEFADGSLLEPEWWGGAEGGWVAWSGSPIRVLSDSPSQFSVEPDGDRSVLVQSRGYAGDFLADEIGVRIAPSATGPFPRVATVFRPAETAPGDVFAHSARSHAHLTGADVVVTYVPTTPDPDRAAEDANLEYPRFLKMNYLPAE